MSGSNALVFDNPNTLKVFKEYCLEDNGVSYTLVQVIFNGAVVDYVIETDKLESSLEELQAAYGIPFEISNDSPINLASHYSPMGYAQGQCDYGNYETIAGYRECMNEFLKLPSKEDPANSNVDITCTVMPEYTAFDVDHICIKLPIQYRSINSSGYEEVQMKTEFLVDQNGFIPQTTKDLLLRLYPEYTTVLNDLFNYIAQLREDAKEGRVIYSVNYYNYLQKLYYQKSLPTKAVINAIRLSEDITDFSAFYHIMQIDRIQEKPGVQCIRYNYQGTWQSIKIKDYFRDFLSEENADQDPMEVYSKLAYDTEFREEVLPEMREYVETKPIAFFCEIKGDMSAGKSLRAMKLYENLERQRLEEKREIWLQHFLMKYGEVKWEDYLSFITLGRIQPYRVPKKTWRINLGKNNTTYVDEETGDVYQDNDDYDVVEIKVSEYKPRK